MTHIYSGPSYAPHQGNPKRCRASVHSNGMGAVFYQCLNKPVVYRIVEGKEYGFCKIHDPVAVDKKNKERRAKWDAEWAAKEANHKYQEQKQKAFEACKKALEQIVAGHNDAKSLARETLELFPTLPKEAK